MAHFIKLTRKTSKDIFVNPAFVAAYELAEIKGCCVIRFSDGSLIEIRADLEELTRLFS